MARGKGTANLAASLEVLAGAPLDARDVCPTVADLYVASNWPYKYIGMKTTVVATGDTYRLVNLDVTQESSWVLDGGGGSGSGGHTIEGDGTELTQRDTLNFVGFDCEDDDTEEKTQVAAHALTAAEMAEIISPMPVMDVSNTSADAFVFSTDERVIGQWIDGKPLYQKTVDCGALPNATYKSVAHNISNLDKVVSFSGVAIGATGNAFQLGYAANFINNANANIKCVVKPTVVEITTEIDYSTASGHVTIRYTKTSDSAVSTGEKIVGQWIDGKALFEKVITGTTDASNNSTIVSIGASVDKAFAVGGYLYTSGGSTLLPYASNVAMTNLLKAIIWCNDASTNANTVEIYTSTDGWKNKPFAVVVRYTKV